MNESQLTILKWCATIYLIVATGINAFYGHPLGPSALGTASLLWTITAIKMNDTPLTFLNATMMLLNFGGLFFYQPM